MAKQIAKLLKTDVMADIDMPAIAQFLQSQGRRGDSILAHINPKEAALLQRMGGAATANPVTGLPEFYDGEDAYSYDTTKRNIVDTITAPESQIGRVPRSSFEGDFGGAAMPNDFDMPRYSDSEPSNRIFSQPTGGTRISADYLKDFNVGGAGDFGVSPAQVPYYGTPQTQDRFFSAGGAPYSDLMSAGFPTRPDVNVQAAASGVPAPEGPGIVRRSIEGLKDITGLSGSDLGRLGLAAGLGIQGALASREAAKQGEEARREQEAIAAPYRERGAQLLAQAERGELNPQGQQSLAAMRARVAQGAESRGGVGAQQAQAQIESYRQQLLANQYDYGMKISNVGDQLMMGAIRTGLEADRYATQMTNNYYTNMARILVGMGTDENEIKQITQSGTAGGQ